MPDCYLSPVPVLVRGFERANKMASYRLPYIVHGITDTSQGHLAMVELYGKNAGIFTASCILLNLRIPKAQQLHSIARLGEVLFITDMANSNIHVITEQNMYLKTVYSQVTHPKGITTSDGYIWVTRFEGGMYRLAIDKHYSITEVKELSAAGNTCLGPVSISVMNMRVAVACYSSHNVHVFNTGCKQVAPPLGVYGTADGQLNFPTGVVMDAAEQFYVADHYNQRVVLLSKTGIFVRNIVTKADGLLEAPSGLFLRNNTLYITFCTIITCANFGMYVIELV